MPPDQHVASTIRCVTMTSQEGTSKQVLSQVAVQELDKVTPISLPPEIEEGNLEYKLKLVAPSSSRFEHLVTQMKWRLQEGAGEAIYEIGVEDSGKFIGLSDGELAASRKTLQLMADRLGASLTTLQEVDVSDGRRVLEVLVRKVPDDQQFLELRIAVLGNVDCGKSTLIGVLAHGELDNGRGRARLNLFRHRHEIRSGRTSSISKEIIGFDSQGELQNYSENLTAEEICDNSTKIIHFIDVPGHQKYLKTTIFGLMAHSPHLAMLVVSANSGIAGTTKEQLGFALCLQVPIFVVVTKVDCCRSAILQKNLCQLEQLLRSSGIKRIPMSVDNESDAVLAASKMSDDQVIPIFKLSSITGKGTDVLEKFLNVLPTTANTKELEKLSTSSHPLFCIDEVFSDVPDVGLVGSGIMKAGCIKEDDTLMVGPMDDGQFVKANITSIHRNRVACRMVRAGQAAALAMVFDDNQPLSIRKGMILASAESQPDVCLEFKADIKLLFHATSISSGFECTLHAGTVCQTAKIEKMTKKSLKTNETASVNFKFMYRPEYIATSSKILFRQGTTRGVGTVTKIIPYTRVI